MGQSDWGRPTRGYCWWALNHWVTWRCHANPYSPVDLLLALGRGRGVRLVIGGR